MDGFIREQNIHVYVLFLWRIIAFLSCENETCVIEQGLPYTPCPLWLWGLNSLQSLQYLYRRWHEELNSTIKVTTLTNKWMIQIITVHVTCGQIITKHSIQMPCQWLVARKTRYYNVIIMEIIENYNWNFVWIFGSFLFFIIYGVTIFVFSWQITVRLTLISQWKPSLKYSSMGGTTGRVLSVSVSDFWIKYNKCHKTIV